MITQSLEPKPKSKIYLMILIIVIIIAVIFAMVLIFLWQSKKNDTEKRKKTMEIEALKDEMANIQTQLNEGLEISSPTPSATLTPTPSASPTVMPPANYQYKIDYVKTYPENLDTSKLSDEELKWLYDKKLVQVDKKTEKETVLVDSIKKSVPDLQAQFNLTLAELSFPKTPTELYFTTILMETDAPPFGVYAYNINDKSFKKLGISDDFSGWIYLVTRDEKKIVAPSLFADYGSVRELLLLDLENDQKKILVTLPKNETLDENADGMGPTIQLKWIDDVTIEYDVYDQSKVTKEMIDQMGKKPKIATRQINIE